MTLWLPTPLISLTRQSNATTAEARTGEPVASVVHSPVAKRSSRLPLRPEKRLAISSSSARSVLTQNTRLALSTGAELLRRLRQTRSVGGASDTEATAVAVKPV